MAPNEASATVGRAVSADGIHWVTDPANPIMSAPGGPAWNGRSIMHVWFIRTNNDYKFWFAGINEFSWNVGMADGIFVCD